MFYLAPSAVLAGGFAAVESATAAQRFVGAVWHQCTTNNAACNPVGAGSGTSKLRLSLGSPFGNTPVAGVTVSITAAVINGGVLDADSGLWLSSTTKSGWGQVADTAGADRNGTYTFAVSHETAVANTYLAKIHCENVAVGSLPVPDSSVGIHTGTGILVGGTDVPNNATTTGADYNQPTDQ